MVKQSPRLPASNVSANSALTLELQTPGGPYSRRKKRRKKKKQQQEHRNVAPDKSPDCVMTSAATLKLNFSEAFKTLLKRKHSHSHEVKWYITEFMLPINHLERRDGLWSHRQGSVLSTENTLLTNPGHDLSNKRDNDSLRSCLWFLSNSNKVPHGYFMMKLPIFTEVIWSFFESIVSSEERNLVVLQISSASLLYPIAVSSSANDSR